MWSLTFFIALILAVSLAHADLKRDAIQGYTLIQLTDNDRSDYFPRVSSQGLVVWVAGYHLPGATSANESDPEIFLWDGTSIVQLTDNDVPDERVVVNNSGDIAWQRFGAEEEAEIFVRTSGGTVQLTNDSVGVKDRYPDINDAGVVVWGRRLDGYWKTAVHDPAESLAFSVAGVLGYRPHINLHKRYIADEFGIRNLSGNIAQVIPSPESLGYSHYRRLEINDNDQLALEADPGPEIPWNPDGEGPRDILFWNGSEMQTLYRSPGPWVGRADLNNNGVVAFEGFGGLETSVSSPVDTEIFVYDPDLEVLVQLTDDAEQDWWPTVSDDGSVIWHGTGNYSGAAGPRWDREIFVARSNGDFDEDGEGNSDDNCPLTPNPLQNDSGGLDTQLEDGIGDACQCGDVNGDGGITSDDTDMLRLLLAGLIEAVTAPEKCGVSPQTTACDLLNLVLTRRALEDRVPALEQACIAARPAS